MARLAAQIVEAILHELDVRGVGDLDIYFETDAEYEEMREALEGITEKLLEIDRQGR